MEDEMKRERNTGRYAPRDFDAVCKCGHTLGVHSAERVKCSDGVTRQHCMSGDLGGEVCDCETYKRQRKPRGEK